MRKYLPFFLLPILILIDQLTKYMVRSQGGFYICNKQLAFGLAMPPSAIVFLSSFFIILFVFWLLSKKFPKPFSVQAGLVLILAGALSNILDRLALSCVIDFIDLPFWPVFNLADIFITLGVIILVVLFFIAPKSKV